MDEKEKLLQDLARRYTEGYGKSLLEERANLEQDGDIYPAKNLERRVMRAVRPRKLRVYLGTAAAMAAILALVVIGSYILPQARFPGASDSAPPPSDAASDTQASAPSSSDAIPLSFAVPVGFTKSGFEQDNEKSIYYFDDSMKDNVVLTMEKSSQSPDTAGMTTLNINGSTAYASVQEGYSLLTFNKDGVLYELTCRYDINTLTLFGNEIL